MARLIRSFPLEPTLNRIVGVTDTNPATAGLDVAVGSIVLDSLGNIYRKTDAATTDWTLILSSAVSDPNDLSRLRGAGAPTNGIAGTGAGIAGPGSTYVDYTNSDQYVNYGTKASPVWSAVRVLEA